MEKTNLLGLDRTALAQRFAQAGHKSFRVQQVMRWVHQRGVANFEEMTDLAKTLREQLSHDYTVQLLPVMAQQKSKDGTRKWLFDVGDHNGVETVFIPEDDRGTLCVSSQAGCTVACRFCSTGHQGFNRNLTTAEIIDQLWYARHVIQEDMASSRTDQQGQGVDRVITNVVMMGMGEPLLNYNQVVPALRLMLDDNAYGLSRRRVTVSTSGVIPMMDRLSQDCPVALAVSLHAPNDALRDQLIPLNKKYPLHELLDACNRYLNYAPRDFITFEYIMLNEINDTERHANELIGIAKQVRCKLNLIPFNPFPESGLKSSTPARVRAFADRLQSAGIVTTVRKTRGDDIDAACGQLAGDVKDKTQIKARMHKNKFIPIEVKYE